MMNRMICTLMAAGLSLSAFAQKSDGTTKSLAKAGEDFAADAAKDGVKSAFISHSASNALVFRPNPVNAKTYYSTQSNEKNLSRNVDYARVSRSGDWGFSSGGYTKDGAEKTYGQYLTIWKAVANRWEVLMDMETTHNKPLKVAKAEFVEPKDYFKPKYGDEKQISAGREIINTTEKTLNATLKSYGVAAFGGFLAKEARVSFPGYEPVIGKDKIVAFYNSFVDKMNLKTTVANKAPGGDLAYTYGLATIDYRTDLRESFNYIFVYERQADHNWYLVEQIFTPAER
ncbi:nuclear transport factor 2 family protein [Pedobacter antarcticus]|nr:nuclear transport factor 2 family protein [Pedobacter antarcticus]SDM01376.1 protein of unknown function [Pedobacter antarcticus]SFF47959.1 protein of unknown function [Pedobacter antarcticus]